MIDYDIMLEMVFHSMTIIEKGYDTVWDVNLFNFIARYFQEGMEYVEKLVKQNGIRIRLIVEVTLENIDSLDLLEYYDVRCLENIKGTLEYLTIEHIWYAYFRSIMISPVKHCGAIQRI
jgi:hypothetical protein